MLLASLDAKRVGDDDLACRLWDTSREMRRTIGRETWRSLGDCDGAELREIIAELVARGPGPR